VLPARPGVLRGEPVEWRAPYGPPTRPGAPTLQHLRSGLPSAFGRDFRLPTSSLRAARPTRDARRQRTVSWLTRPTGPLARAGACVCAGSSACASVDHLPDAKRRRLISPPLPAPFAHARECAGGEERVCLTIVSRSSSRAARTRPRELAVRRCCSGLGLPRQPSARRSGSVVH
jgi:hypothetical protein